MSNIEIILVVPFFNESLLLKKLLESLLTNQYEVSKVYFIGVDHSSTDQSRNVINEFRGIFGELEILEETTELRCTGIPRNKGFRFALSIANKVFDEFGKNPAIVSIDCDSRVSPFFLNEIARWVPSICSLLVFQTRNDPIILRHWIASQENGFTRDSAVRALFGLDWLRFQLHQSFKEIYRAETRAPAGYALSPSALEQIQHKQPFDNLGRPILGESNRLGIIAYRMRLKSRISDLVTFNHPRREIHSARSAENKGYTRNPKGDELFTIRRESISLPKLSEGAWKAYLEDGIRRALAMFLTRSIAYDCLGVVDPPFSEHPTWKTIVRLTVNQVALYNPDPGDTAIIGSAVFRQIFDNVAGLLGKEILRDFTDSILQLIPENLTLMEWAESPSESHDH